MLAATLSGLALAQFFISGLTVTSNISGEVGALSSGTNQVQLCSGLNLVQIQSGYREVYMGGSGILTITGSGVRMGTGGELSPKGLYQLCKKTLFQHDERLIVASDSYKYIMAVRND